MKANRYKKLLVTTLVANSTPVLAGRADTQLETPMASYFGDMTHNDRLDDLSEKAFEELL